jgi:hypothetical protein
MPEFPLLESQSGQVEWNRGSTRHLATGGVEARFNYVLVTNSNPVLTCASDGQVNPYPNKDNRKYCTCALSATVPGSLTTVLHHKRYLSNVTLVYLL